MSEDEKLLKECKKLSWEDRLAHKNWKVRVDANTDIAALCDSISDPKDPKLKDFGPLFRKAVADANAPAQEKALDALIAYLRVVDTDSGRYAKEICDSVVVKCLTGRVKTIEKAQMVLLLWVELEATEVFLDVMEKAIKNKVAKAVVPAIDVMYQAVSQFGTKVVPPKRILKMLPELFDHQDQNVRASAKGLTIELCRWISKDIVKSILFEKMRDTMKKELEVEVDNVTGLSKPTRKIRSEQLKEEVEVAVDTPDQASADEPTVQQETDDYELMDPVDILGPLQKTTFWEGVKATKWSERRDAVTELTKLASARRLAVGDYVEVSRILKKLITDVNLAVAVEAVQAAGNLARGLRKDYSGGSRLLLPLLLERLKEKKAVMVDAVMQTLQTMHKSGCFALGDVIEEVKVATKNKVPSVRSSCLNWVGFCIESSNKANIMKVYKEYVPILLESLTDGTPEVRDAAFGGIAAVAKLIGMKPLEKSLEKLDDVRRKRLAELIGPDPSTAPPLVAVRGSVGGGSTGDSMPSGGSKSAASLLSGKRPSPAAAKSKVGVGTSKAAGSTAKKAEGGSSGPAKAAAAARVEKPEDLEGGEVSPEDLEARIEAQFGGDIVTSLKSAVWKERLEGIVSLQTKLAEAADLDPNTETLVRFLSILPGWAEKNVQVQQKSMEIISFIAEKSNHFSKRCVVLCLAGVVEKSSDIKLRIQATKCLTSFCEVVEPVFVVSRLLTLWKDHKNPKVVSEGLTWLLTAMEDFGVGLIPVKEVITFCKDVALQSSTAATRNAGVKVLGLLHKFCGPDIKNYFSDLKPALQTLVTAECDKNPYAGEVVAPKRSTRAVAAGAGVGGAEGLPREDISGKVTAAILKNFTSADWKVRQEAIEAVNTILQEANMRIQATGTGELIGALKGRLSDSNKNLVIMTLATLGKVAQAMGPGFDKCFKVIHADVLKCLGDNKKMMREAAVKTLDSWLAVLQMSKMLSSLSPALLDTKLCADGRKDMFDWFAKHVAGADDMKEVSTLIKPIVTGVQDKSAEVRKAAEGLFIEIVKACGHEMVDRASRSFHGPALTLLQSLLEKHGLKGGGGSAPAEVVVDEAPRGPTLRGAAAQKAAAGGPQAAGKRVPMMRGGGVRESKADAADAAQQGQALFNLKDCNKEEREKLHSRRPKFDSEQRGEQIQDVEGDVVKYLREDVHRRLMSPDFKKQVEGVDILQKAIPTHVREMMEVLDVLLRWIVVRVFEGNTTVLLKVLDFLQDLVLAFKAEGYSMTDCEANYIFPCLVEKSGHNSEKVREKFRELLRLLCCLYPSSKIFTFLLDGLRSKNNRTKIECVEQLGFLIERYGVEVGGSGKGLQAVVALTTERDGDLRKASLNTLAVAYQILGDDVWRYIGRLSEVQRSLLDEKFKWKAREMEKKKEGKPGEARGAMRRSPRENGVDDAEQMVETNHQAVSSMVSNNSSSLESNFRSTAHMQPVGPLDWKDAIYVIENSTVSEQVVEGMKLICYELEQAVGDADGILMEELVSTADRLVCSLSARVASTFKAGLSGSSSRACKYVLNTLMQTFQIKRLAYEIKEESLHSLFTELLLWLLDDRVPLLDDGSQLLKALNVLVLKILENANRTSAFVVLIDLLQPSAGKGDRNMLSSHRFSDLVVKCLIKLTKVLGSTINEVDLDRLLQSIHDYFQQLGLEEIRKRAGADDKPLRMVKTVLHELVKLRGTSVKGHLSMVPIDSEPQPIILAYIDLNLQTLAAARTHMLTPAGTGSQGHWLDNSGNGPSSNSTSSAETQLKQELAAIFKKIGDKQTCTVGLYELYRITQLYPQVDIFSQLQNASMAFRTYIRDGLAQMEKSAAAGRTPSSMSVVSPPPLSSSNMSYPTKGAPNHNSSHISSQHNSYGEDAEVGSARPTYAVDSSSVRQAMHQRHVETSPYESSGDTHSESNVQSTVVGGTLNAIRERMKNIQAAAAGSTGSGNYNIPSVTSVEPMSHQHLAPPGDVEHRQREPIPDKALSGLQARMERLKNGVVEPAVLV